MRTTQVTADRLATLGKRWCPGCGMWHRTDLHDNGCGAFRTGSDLCVVCEDIQAKLAQKARMKEEAAVRAWDLMNAADGCDGTEEAWALSDAARKDGMHG